MPSLPDSSLVAAAHARARGWGGLFRLPLRQHVWRGMTGDFMGKGTGSSLDFQDHRAYAPGDDPRHINWQAYARTGQYSMKLFREEVRPVIDIVFDVSPSMFFDPDKAARAVELFAFAIEGAQRAGAVPAVWLCGAGKCVPVPAEGAMSGAWRDLAPDGEGTATEPPDVSRIPWRALSLRVLVSDLLFPGAPDPVVSALASRQGRGVILVPFCQAECDPGWDGNIEFFDVEGGQRQVRRVETPLLRRYGEAYRRHFTLWKTAAVRQGVVMARVPAAPPFPQALQLEALPVGAVEPWA